MVVGAETDRLNRARIDHRPRQQATIACDMGRAVFSPEQRKALRIGPLNVHGTSVAAAAASAVLLNVRESIHR
jgi:hypothetical protein